jgi:hypothetical protein
LYLNSSKFDPKGHHLSICFVFSRASCIITVWSCFCRNTQILVILKSFYKFCGFYTFIVFPNSVEISVCQNLNLIVGLCHNIVAIYRYDLNLYFWFQT